MIDYDKLDAMLNERGQSRRQLAIAAGISVSKMSMWFVRHTKNIPIEDLCAMAFALGVSPRAIVRDDVLKLIDGVTQV